MAPRMTITVPEVVNDAEKEVWIEDDAAKESKEGSSHLDEDRGWAWVVFGAVLIGRAIVLGTLLTFGIYFAHYLDIFSSSRSVAGLIGSIMWFLYDLSALFNGLVIHRFGPRKSVIFGSVILTISFLLSTLATDIFHLLCSQGLLLGIGSNLISLSFVVALKMYFRKYINLTQGVSTSGAGVGVFVLGFIVPHLLDIYGWRGAFIIHAGLVLQVCVAGVVIFPLRFHHRPLSASKSPTPIPSAPASSSIRSVWKRASTELFPSKCFWCLVLSYFCFNFSYVASILFFKDFVNMRNLHDFFSIALAAFGIGDIVGRLCSGIFSSWKHLNPILFFSIVQSSYGVFLIIQLTTVSSGISLIIVTFFVGLVSGCANGLFFVVPSHLYSSDIFLAAFGCCSALGGLGTMTSTPLTGFIVDKTRSYSSALGMASGFSFMASILLFILYRCNKVYPSNSSQSFTSSALRV